MEPVIFTLIASSVADQRDAPAPWPIVPWVSCDMRGPTRQGPTPQARLVGRLFDKPGQTSGPWPQGPQPKDSLLSRLISQHWGEYIAVVAAADGEAISILPEPTGLLDVYYVKTRDGVVASTSFHGIRRLLGKGLTPNDKHLVDGALSLDRFGPGTPFEGVNRIPFGHALDITRDGKTSLRRLWPVYFSDDRRAAGDVDTALETLLVEVVRCQTTPQTALMLSGGRDSSLIAGLISKAAPSTADRLTCIHAHNPSGSNENELEFARHVAQATGADLHVFGPEDLMSVNGGTSRLFPDEDGVFTLPIEAFFERETSCGHFLDGKGGDTVFVDLPETSYVNARSFNEIARDKDLSNNLAYILDAKLLAPLRPHIYLRNLRWRFMKQFNAMSVLTPAVKQHYRTAENWRFFRDQARWLLNEASLPKATYASVVLGDLMYQTHRATTRQALSYPFLAQPVLEFMLTLDLNTIYTGESRTLQRRLLRRFDLHKIADRTFKSGMTSLLMRGASEAEQELMDAVTRGHFVQSGLVDPAVLARIMNEIRAGFPSLGMHAFSKIAMLENLIELYGAAPEPK